MEITLEFQQVIVKSIEEQFYNMILNSSNGFNDTYLKLELKNLIEIIHHTILQYYFEDELLLRLFEIHEYTINYQQSIKPTKIACRLSA